MKHTKDALFIPPIGWSINHAIDYVINMAKTQNKMIEMAINGVVISVHSWSTRDAVMNIYGILLKEKELLCGISKSKSK